MSARPLSDCLAIVRVAVLGIVMGCLAGQVAQACTPPRSGDPPLPSFESLYLVVWDAVEGRPNGQVGLTVIERYHGPERSELIAFEPRENLATRLGAARWVAGFSQPANGIHPLHRISGCYSVLCPEDAFSQDERQKLFRALGLEGAQ